MKLSSQTITNLCDTSTTRNWDFLGTSFYYRPAEPMISPFVEKSLSNGMTYGLSEAGYDIRIAQDVTLYPATFPFQLLDLLLEIPRRLKWTTKHFKPYSLASTMERFCLPTFVMFSLYDKSTWARKFSAVQNTCAEPGWKGWLTVELTNHSYDIIKIKAGTPIAQAMFEFLDRPTDKPYRGKYQDQPDRPVEAIMEVNRKP